MRPKRQRGKYHPKIKNVSVEPTYPRNNEIPLPLNIKSISISPVVANMLIRK